MMDIDFPQQLKRQIRFLENSCSLYDAGDFDEAIRMATCLRVLFHTTRNSTSVLTHLDAESVKLLSTKSCVPGQIDAWGLVKVRMVARPGEPVRAFPKLDDAKDRTLIPFQDWWASETILAAFLTPRAPTTRRLLTLWVANKDGGAHVDCKLDPDYIRVIDGLGFGVTHIATDRWEFSIDKRSMQPMQNLHFASLRQIAYEVLNSPDLLRLVPTTTESASPNPKIPASQP
jgi:hypothetical protein